MADVQREALKAHSRHAKGEEESDGVVSAVEKARSFMKILHEMAKNFEESSVSKSTSELSITSLTISTFDKMVVPSEYALVNFYSPKCAYCKQFHATFEKIAQWSHERYGTDKLLVAQVDATEEEELAQSFMAEALPYVLWFKRGKGYRAFQGRTLQSLGSIKAWIERMASDRDFDEEWEHVSAEAAQTRVEDILSAHTCLVVLLTRDASFNLDLLYGLDCYRVRISAPEETWTLFGAKYAAGEDTLVIISSDFRTVWARSDLEEYAEDDLRLTFRFAGRSAVPSYSPGFLDDVYMLGSFSFTIFLISSSRQGSCLETFSAFARQQVNDPQSKDDCVFTWVDLSDMEPDIQTLISYVGVDTDSPILEQSCFVRALPTGSYLDEGTS
jgi:thiol-disulfide isomerase/thioredoxin